MRELVKHLTAINLYEIVFQCISSCVWFCNKDLAIKIVYCLHFLLNMIQKAIYNGLLRTKMMLNTKLYTQSLTNIAISCGVLFFQWATSVINVRFDDQVVPSVERVQSTQYNTMQYDTMQCNTAQCKLQERGAIQYSCVQYASVLFVISLFYLNDLISQLFHFSWLLW